MTVAVAKGPEQRISEPSSYARILARYNSLSGPAQVAALSDGRVVVVYETLEPFTGVYMRIVSPDGSLSPEVTCDGVKSASVVVPRPPPEPAYENDFIVVSYMGDTHGSVLANWYAQDGSSRSGGTPHLLLESITNASGTRSASVFAPTAGNSENDAILIACSRSPNSLFSPNSPQMQVCTFRLNYYGKSSFPFFEPANNVVKNIGGTLSSDSFNSSIQAASLFNMFAMVGNDLDLKVWVAACRPDGSLYTGFGIGDGSYPTLAGSGSNCIVVWQNQHQVRFAIHSMNPYSWPSINPTPSASGQVNQSSFGNRPALAILTSGKFVVAWEEDGLRGRIFNPDGSPATDQFVLCNQGLGAATPSIAATPDGGFYVAFMRFEGNHNTPVLPDNPMQWIIKGQAWAVS